MDLDLKLIFEVLDDEDYVMIKMSTDFPFYSSGDDIDILCRDLNKISQILLSQLYQLSLDEFRIGVTKRTRNHYHIDILNGGTVHLRFDLYSSLPEYSKVKFKPSYFDVIIQAAEVRLVEKLRVKVPSTLDESILRYAEYTEYFSSVPDKIKHAEHILQSFETNKAMKSQFFERLHYFLYFPNIEVRRQTILERSNLRGKYLLQLIEKALHVQKQSGLKALIHKLLAYWRKK